MAALVTLAAVLPGVLFLPAIDRSETRLAEASAQMLENRDFAAAAIDDDLRDRTPLAAHWLQTGAVTLSSDPEARRIWAFRLPAIAGALIAAAACAWGGAALVGPAAGLLAGIILGSGTLVSAAGVVDTPSALLSGGVTLAMAAMARLRLAAEGEQKAGAPTRILFWLGLAVSMAAGGLVGPAVVGLAAGTLWLAERRAPWLAGLGWGWGLILLAALAGPSIVAGAIDGGGPSALSWLNGGSGDRTPGFQLLIAPLLTFPFALLLPAALMAMLRARRDAGARIAVCWLLPTWIWLEFTRGQAPARGLVVYGALAWLCALAVRDGVGTGAARLGAALQTLAAAVFVAGLLYLAQRFGDDQALAWAGLAAGLAAAAGLVPAALMLSGRTGPAMAAAALLGLLAHGAALYGVAPRLEGLWVARRAAAALTAAGLDPRAGVTPGPVSVVGYTEPSLDFALGGQTDAETPEEAAAALRTGRPVIVEARQEDAFLAAARFAGPLRRAGEASGFDYANGSTVRLEIYAPARR